ncbi:MAG: macrocin O-methyltransferase [Candidatus Competibacteraceae bacterium]|nr:macrocin O-methyltransferase [Candidatus Competibacteraceae bacterium]
MELTHQDRARLTEFSRRALSTFPTVQNSFECAWNAIKDGVPGDIVECGVFAGTQSAAMAWACMRQQQHRKVHLFDSFAGIPKAGPKDDETITALIGTGNGELETTGVSACSVESVKSNMVQWQIDPSLLHYHKGWFQDTVPLFKVDAIAVLRLDGDLYESTKVCLEHLMPKVSKGGCIIIDDYALTGCRRAVDEYLAAHNLSPEIQVIEGGLGPVYWIVS